MVKITEYKYIINYDELMELLQHGYNPICELKIVLDHYPYLLKNSNKIAVYIEKEWKAIDIYSYYYEEQRCPRLFRNPNVTKSDYEAKNNGEKLSDLFID